MATVVSSTSPHGLVLAKSPRHAICRAHTAVNLMVESASARLALAVHWLTAVHSRSVRSQPAQSASA
eukprot:144706-Prymnesium_polylepis.1